MVTPHWTAIHKLSYHACYNLYSTQKEESMHMDVEALINSLIDYTMAVEAWGSLAASDATPRHILKSSLAAVMRATDRCQAAQPQGELGDA
jgi:hypothetical protein